MCIARRRLEGGMDALNAGSVESGKARARRAEAVDWAGIGGGAKSAKLEGVCSGTLTRARLLRCQLHGPSKVPPDQHKSGVKKPAILCFPYFPQPQPQPR